MGEAEGGDPPGRRGSHFLLRETPPHSAAHPPSRSRQLRGCFSTAGQRAAVSPRWALVVRLSPIPRLLLFTGRAPLERAQWRRERVADPRLGVAQSTTQPRRRRQEQVKTAGGKQDGGSGVRVLEGRDPRSRSRNPKPMHWRVALPPKSKIPNGGLRGRRRPLAWPVPPRRRGSEASARGRPWRAARPRARAGAAAAASASQFLAGFRVPDTPLLDLGAFFPSGFRLGLDLARVQASSVFPWQSLFRSLAHLSEPVLLTKPFIYSFKSKQPLTPDTI